MNQEPRDLLESHPERIVTRVRLLGSALTLGIAILLGLGGWNLKQAQQLAWARDRDVELQETLDSLRAAHSALELRLQASFERVRVLESRMRRLDGGERNSELRAVRNWIRRLESNVEMQEGRLGTVEGRLEQNLWGAQAPHAPGRDGH